MRILGISAFYHDSAAAMVIDGRVIAAAQEERFTRKKHDADFPHNAIGYCLAESRVALKDIDFVVFYDKPFLKFERLLETYLAFAPKGFPSFRMAMPLWLREKLFQRNLLGAKLGEIDPDIDLSDKLLFVEHHLSHAASAYFPSPFEEAVVLTLDGVGEWATTSVALGRGRELQVIREIHFPHSLGMLYSAFTYYTGFKVNSGEYKLMGLAPYGEPRFANLIREHLLDLKPDGSFRLNQDYFDYCTGLRMTNSRFDELFGGAPRRAEDKLTQREMDLAASVQKVLEDVVLTMTRALAKETGMRNLCLAGGVALNCVANGKILRDGAFSRMWIPPAAGDAGGAIGAALSVFHGVVGGARVVPAHGDGLSGSYLGPEFAEPEIEQRLHCVGAVFEVLADDEVLSATADSLVAGHAVGWFQGRMEFGPRALGNRSILADPRSSTMQSALNLKVKYRESFRPFAPAVLREQAAEWFDLDTDSPYMLLVADVVQKRRRPKSAEDEKLFGIDKLNISRSDIPAVTHVDYSARVQTVDAALNPRFHALISAFAARSGCPVLVNTSFNVRGEPLVCTPEDAFRCFMGTEIDILVVGNCVLRKELQDPALKLNYETRFELD